MAVRSRRLRAAARALLGISAALVIILATRWGPALGDDSYFYIKPARDALSGQPIEFNPSFPPLLPIVLTALGHLGVEPLVGLRFLNAALFAAIVLLSYELLIGLGQRPATIAFLGALSILLSARLIEVSASAMSEPLYISLALAGLWAASRYLSTSRSRWLIAAGICVGLAAFTRYAGIALICAVAFVLLLRGPRSMTKRVAQSLGFLALSCAPLAAYVARNLAAFGQPVGQDRWSWALVREFPWRSLVRNFIDWVLPGKFLAGLEAEILVVTAVAVAASVMGYAILYRESLAVLLAKQLRKDSYLLLIVFAASTLVLLALSRGFFAGGDSFNRRYLSPVQVTVFLMAFGLAAAAYSRQGRWTRSIILASCLAFTALLALRAGWTVRYLWAEGSGYSSRRWHISETIRYLNYRPDLPVMSTAAPGVYFWTGRLPLDIPRNNSREAAREFLCRTGGFLVIIDSMPTEFYGIDHEELTQGLIVEQDFSEGTIYRIDPAECGATTTQTDR